MESDKLIQYLHQLIAEACSYPKGSLERNKRLTEIISLMQNSGKILRDSQLDKFDYEDALSKTWVYFCQNLCEAATAKSCFDSEIANVFTWFNSYLSHRIRDRLIENEKERHKRIIPQIDPEIGRLLDPVEQISYISSDPSLIDEIRQWLEDHRSRFTRIHVRNNPDANVYNLILHHLVFDTPWSSLSQKFQVQAPTLSNFYRTKCVTLLVEWYEFQQNSGH